MSGIAIFDLDYTLTKRGTWGRFVWMNIKTRPHIWLPLLISAGWTQFRYKRGHLPRIRVKMAMMRWAMVGQRRSKLENLAEKFADREVRSGLRPGAILALKNHKMAGDLVIIASAAVDLVVAPIAEKLGINYYVATDMAWDEDGRLKAEFASENCYGDEKLRRLEALFADNPELKQNHTIITSYSDSYSDLAMLRFYDIGVSVNPDRRLASEASGLGLGIENWN